MRCPCRTTDIRHEMQLDFHCRRNSSASRFQLPHEIDCHTNSIGTRIPLAIKLHCHQETRDPQTLLPPGIVSSYSCRHIVQRLSPVFWHPLESNWASHSIDTQNTVTPKLTSLGAKCADRVQCKPFAHSVQATNKCMAVIIKTRQSAYR